MDYLKLATEHFSNDIFATQTTGVIIESADIDYAKCSLKIEKKHLNAANIVMGGAIFTLADFTFAIAANIAKPTNTVSLTSQINYLGTAKGTSLIAETKCIKSGRTICVFEINVTDDLGNKVASVSTTGFRQNG